MTGASLPGSTPDVEIFYADPVDEDGNVVATARLEITNVSGVTARATKIPASEIGVDADSPTIRLEEGQ